jgi:hypothetical protein
MNTIKLDKSIDDNTIVLDMINDKYIKILSDFLKDNDCRKIFKVVYNYFTNFIPFIPRKAIDFTMQNDVKKIFENCTTMVKYTKELYISELILEIFRNYDPQSYVMDGGDRTCIKQIIKNMYKGSNTGYIFLMSMINNKKNLPMITDKQYLISKKINNYVNSF